MLNSLLNLFIRKEKKANSCYTYLGPNREYKGNSQSKREQFILINNKTKKPSALSKYFEDAKSLFGDERKFIL